MILDLVEKNLQLYASGGRCKNSIGVHDFGDFLVSHELEIMRPEKQASSTGGKKYVCIGGYVFSGDGDHHFIPSGRLPQLYGVPKEECIFLVNEEWAKGCDFSEYSEFTVLRPRSDGNYTLNQ